MSKKVLFVFLLVLLTVLNMESTAQGVNPGTTNLKHSWTFDDGTPNDYVGGANGTLMGAAEVYGGSLLVINSGDYLQLPAEQIEINAYSAFTMDLWYRPILNGNPSWTMIVYFGGSSGGMGSDGFFLSAARGDNFSRAAISCGVTTNPYTAETGANGPEYDDGELHHMAGILTADSISLYLDGIEQASTKLSPTNYIGGISTSYAYLAKSGYDGDATWLGEILEFNIYDRALTPEEILFLFNRGGSNAISNQSTNIPKEYSLLQNYPNPFNPTTTIEFELPRRSAVHLFLVDIMGKVVRELVNGEFVEGRHKVKLDATDLASGVYFCRMQADNFVDSKKIVLVK